MRCNVILQHDDITIDVITHAHVAGHMTFWYKREPHTMVGGS